MRFLPLVLASLALFGSLLGQEHNDIQPSPAQNSSVPESGEDVSESSAPAYAPRIKDIIISGNKTVSVDAILHRLSWKKGETFRLRESGNSLRKLYAMGYFRYIEFQAEELPNDEMNLHVAVTEKSRLREVRFVGNNNLSEKEIRKKIDFSKVQAIDAEELTKFAQIIKKMYLEKGYHHTIITPSTETEDDQTVATFTVDEGKHSSVRRIRFTGNKHANSKQLRSLLYSREQWLFSFLDSSGMFHPEMLEADRHAIEMFYKNSGYLNAKVVDVTVETDPNANFNITYHIDEGEVYYFGDIKVPGNEFMSEEQLLRIVPIKKGMLFSSILIQRSIEALRTFWGESGYIFTDIEPSIQPNEETKTVNVSLYTELGSKVRVRRINIVGNKKTRDYIVRRQMVVDEGDWITSRNMEQSKNRVEFLGFFDKREGVNWKINRIADDLADLDLILKEVRTGQFTLQVNTNGSFEDYQNPLHTLQANIGFADSNFHGYGIRYNLNLALSRAEQSGSLSLATPWLFNRPMSGVANLYATAVQYEDFHFVTQEVRERRAGGSAGVGLMWAPYDIHMAAELGAENIHYRNQPMAFVPGDAEGQAQFQRIINWFFQPGTYAWTLLSLDQDRRNHPIHPTRGQRWYANLKIGIPIHSPESNLNAIRTDNPNYGFIKFDADAAWFTSLIGENDLILSLHGHVGTVQNFGRHTIPYREIYHIGGPATVRGFTFGQIGPNWRTDSIGASNAFWLNVELIFPIKQDFSMKAAAFYDGGAGWHTPVPIPENSRNLRNNHFNYRHAVGVGIRILSPIPIQVDWGFKLDRNKKIGETASEVHLTMNQAF